MLFLCGCGNEKGNMETALQLRNQLLQCERCTFQADITADYGEQLHRFVADCHADSDGNIYFTVMEPETIAGITGEIHASGGRLTFDDTALGFPLLFISFSYNQFIKLVSSKSLALARFVFSSM